MNIQFGQKKIVAIIVLFYGFIAASSYDYVSSSTTHPVAILPFVVAISLCLTLPFSTAQEVRRELTPNLLLRPILFSLGQLLIVWSLSYGAVLATFVSTALGTIVTILLGRFILREKISCLSLFGISLTLFGAYQLKKNLDMPVTAVLAGVSQGLAVFLARQRGIDGARIASMASAALSCLLISSLLLLVAFRISPFATSNISWPFIVFGGIGFAILQTSYCYLTRHLEAWMLSLVGNSRIPASVLISSLMSTHIFTWLQFGLSILVFSGILISFYSMNKSK